MLLSFLTKAYRSIVNLGCWVFAILSGIGMAFGLYFLFDSFFYELEFLGAVLGFLVGVAIAFWFELNFVVPFTILFEINDKLDILCKTTKNTNNNGVIKSTNNNVAQDFSDAWVCEKCGKENIDNQNSCDFCGEKRFEKGVLL